MKHRYSSGKKTYVMIALLAVLFISMGYLSLQKKEGMTDKKKEGMAVNAKKEGMAVNAKKEGMTIKKKEGMTNKKK